MSHTRWIPKAALLMAMAFLFVHVLELDALARAGGGKSYGSRGSRPMSPPSRSYSSPAPAQPGQQHRGYGPASRPSSPSVSPFWHGLAGGMLGGLIGAMLFRGMGFAGPGAGWGGPGLLDLILIGALLYGIYWFVLKRRRLAAANESAQGYQSSAGYVDTSGAGAVDYAVEELPVDQELARGMEHIRQMDPSFEWERFRQQATDIFFAVQAAWSKRDMGRVRDLLTQEMFGALQAQVDEMRAQGKVNRLENVALRDVEPVEIWQEAGQDFITVRIRASLLDYTVDEATGQVVSGSSEVPVKFDEYWTFTRAVGPNSWRLSAITQV